ncbi:MAG: protein kinase, partial [Candidatus Krumholzibacteria bacterium]|nr:protein kinase [Candidatus Krumholzibacteria bacterium]
IGEGGMGVVYKAQDLKLKRVVALKFLPAEKLGSESDRTRFLHEAQAAAALDHPSICTVHEVVEADEHAFIVMAYIRGSSLEEIIRSGPLELGTAVDYAVQIAEGLQAAHAQNIIHRDIKSANVMVTNVGGARITDFGLARLPDRTRVTQEKSTVGTVSYMSPEQLQGREVDKQTDIWSLGVVLYEMIAGRLPFRGNQDTAVIYSIMNEKPEPLRKILPETPAALEQIVYKAMAKDWEERYLNANELLADLRQIQTAIKTGEAMPAVSSSKATVSQIGAQIVRRLRLDSRRAWIAAVAVVVVILGVFIFYPNSAVPFVERDWIVIADFENLTGDDVFDHSLDMALSVSLSQSQYVNVFPRRRAEQAITRMKLKDVDRIDESMGREIAAREGVRILVVPTISGVGDNYTLTGAIQDTETGENLLMEMVRADGKDEVLDALDDLANKIREDLGEAKRSISLKSKPLRKVTTSSLEALKRYSMGFEKQQQGQFEESRRHYGYAVENDSEFAMALGALGMVEYLHFDRVKGLDYFNRAIEYADQITEPEAYLLRAGHAIAVEEDYEKAAQIYRMAAEEYPDASTYHNNLGAVYGLLGRHQDAADEYKEAIRAEPTLMIAYNGLVTEYMIHLGRVDLALEWSRRQMAYQPESSWPYHNLAYAYIGADSIDNAIEALGRSLEFDLEFAESLELLGHTLLLLGLYDEASTAYAHLLEATPDAVEPHYYMGIASELLGQNARARDYYGRFAQITQWRIEDQPDNPYYYIDLGIVRTRMGQNDRARAAAARATAIDPTAHLSYARLSSVQGNADNSLEHIVRAIDGGYRDLIYVKFHPDFQLLRNDPRLTELLDRHLKK